MNTKKKLLFAIIVSALSSQTAFAQCDGKTGFAKQLCQVHGAQTTAALGEASDTALKNLKSAPLTTALSDTIHGDIQSPSIDPPAFSPLLKLERADDGAFILKPGIYEAYVESYSLEPYDPGYGRGSAFFPAPIKGRRAKVISDILKYAEVHPDIPQAIIQNLLGLTVFGTDLEKMPAPTQQAAAKLLPSEALGMLHAAMQAETTKRTIISILGGRIGANAKAAQDITGAVAKAKQLDQQYGVTQTVKDMASSQGVPIATMARGSWVQMPGGFYLRYLPENYVKTRLQIIVPEAAMQGVDSKTPLTFDPTRYLAVHTGTPAQRLGITLRPVGGR